MHDSNLPESGPIPLEQQQYRGNRRHLNFDPTINAGHILTFVSMATLVIAAWVMMDKRLTVLEEARVYQSKHDDVQEAVTRDKLNDLVEAIRELRRSIERRNEKER